MLDRIARIATSASLRALLPNGIPIGLREDGDVICYKDKDGNVHDLMSLDDAQTVTGVKTFTALPVVSADGGVRYAEIALTANEIKALRATPKELVAAPGAGKIVRFLGAELLLDATATAFAETADNMAVKYENGTGAAASDTIEATGFIDQVADTKTSAVPVKDAIVAKTGCENKALVLHNTGDGEYATGTGTMRVKVWYSVLTTGW